MTLGVRVKDTFLGGVSKFWAVFLHYSTFRKISCWWGIFEFPPRPSSITHGKDCPNKTLKNLPP
jgi:hypothetical protein